MITKLEIRRQLAHIFLGLVLYTLITLDIINYYHMFLATFLVLAASTVLKRGHRIWLLSSLLIDNLQRDTEKKGMPMKGAFFYFLGVSITMVLFSKSIVLGSILILAFGDSLSRLIGPYGYLKHPFNNVKFMEGIVVAGIISGILASFHVGMLAAFLAAGAAMFLEGLDIEINGHKVDDNITIPVVAGLVMHIVFLM